MAIGELWTPDTPDYSGGITAPDTGYVPSFDAGVVDWGGGFFEPITAPDPTTSNGGGWNIDLPSLSDVGTFLKDLSAVYVNYRRAEQQVGAPTVTRNPDGSTTRRDANGDLIVTRPDGTSVRISPDGRVTYPRPGGGVGIGVLPGIGGVKPTTLLMIGGGALLLILLLSQRKGR